MCEFSACVAFNKSTNGLTDIKQRKEVKYLAECHCCRSQLKSSLPFSDLCEGGSFSTAMFSSDIQLSVYSFSCFISVCPFVALLKATLFRKCAHCFCLVGITKWSFLTSCMFWFVFLNASSSSHVCFRFFCLRHVNKLTRNTYLETFAQRDR